MLLSTLVAAASLSFGAMTRVAIVPLTPRDSNTLTTAWTVVPRVRSLDPVLARILKDGSERSATMRHLMDVIEKSDVIVYVSFQLTLSNKVEGGLHFVNAAGGQRYLRVVVTPGLSSQETLVVLAHELQHAVEVAQAAWVRSGESMVALYRRIGHVANSRRYETDEAQQIAFAVRDEMGAKTARDRPPCRTPSVPTHVLPCVSPRRP